MAQELLNEAKVDSGFQQMSRPGMAKRMDTGKLIDPALLESFLEGNLNAALWHGFGGTGHVNAASTRSREDEEGIAVSYPVASEDLQSVLRKGDKAVFGSLAMSHMDEHAGAVDVGDPKVSAFLQTQATRVDGSQTGPVAGQTDEAQDLANLFDAQYHRELLLSGSPDEGERTPVTLQSVLEEKLDATKSDGAGGTGEFLDILEIEEILAKLFFRDQIGRFIAVFGKLAHCPDVHLLRRLGQAPELEIFGHPLAEFHHVLPPGLSEWLSPKV